MAAIALSGALVAWPATAAAPASTGIKLPALFKPSPLQVLHVFGKATQSGSLDGIYPEAGLVLASDGRFYGTTAAGGVYGYDPTIQTYGEGTVFSIDTQGHYTRVYSFHHVNADGVFSNVDGREPNRGLIEGADGALYGVAPYSGPNGSGTLFRLSRDGLSFTLLHAFDAGPGATGGAAPESGLTQAPDGVLFGGTSEGGAAPNNPLGVLYRIGSNGSGYTVLRSYTDDAFGAFPEAAPLIAGDGRVYGLTTDLPGTLFSVNRDGSDYVVVHQFDNQCEFYHAGFYPRLLEWSDGYLYGVCIDGGGSGGTNGGGAAFRVARDGSGFQVLHGFATPPPGGVAGITLQPGGDGSHPESPLVPGTDGYFYGTTLEGGAHHNGTIYRMRPDGSGYQLLYSFPAFNLIPLGSVANAQGGSPIGDVAFGGDGKLYGTTAQGGNNGTGVIWSFTPPAP